MGDQGGTGSATFKSQYDIPLNENGYTKSSLELGKKFIKSIWLMLLMT